MMLQPVLRPLNPNAADLAIVRSDIAMPASGQTVLIMRRSAAVLFATSGSSFQSVSDLAGHKVGILRGPPGGGNGNGRLLDTVLAQYDVNPATVERVTLTLAELPKALEDKKIDAVLAVGVPSAGQVADAVAVATQVGVASPCSSRLPRPRPFRKRSPGFESIEVVRGAFGGTPPKPLAAFDTLGVTTRLVARSSLKDSVVGDVTRLLLAARPAIADASPPPTALKRPRPKKVRPFRFTRCRRVSRW